MKVQIVRAQTSWFGVQRLRRRMVFAVVAAVLAPLAIASTAYADDSGDNTSTVTIAAPLVRSITVSPTTSSFGNCTGTGTGVNAQSATLIIPGGGCSLGTVAAPQVVTVTNGAVPGQVYVNGADAIPADSGTPWTLGQPAADVFGEVTINSQSAANLSNPLTNTPACDGAFSQTPTATALCTAPAGQSFDEQVKIFAPASSTDTSSTFTITTTWTAVP